MKSAEPETKTHFELASFVDETIMSSIKEHVLPYSDSIGMNEQELPNLLSLMKYGSAVSVAPAYPRVASVLDQMREIYTLAKNENWPRKMSRMHVHNIAFQAIMVRKESGWRKTMTATAFSALTAHRHVCQTKEIKLENTKLLMDDSFR
jgi:ADP-dependent glucokinase